MERFFPLDLQILCILPVTDSETPLQDLHALITTAVFNTLSGAIGFKLLLHSVVWKYANEKYPEK